MFRGDVQFSEEDMRVGPRLYLGKVFGRSGGVLDEYLERGTEAAQ